MAATDPLLLTGVALAATGLAFKASVAPFHQWTPDVYQGAPTPVTAFMAVATKAAAFAVIAAAVRPRAGASAPAAVGTRAGRAGHGHDPRRQRRRDRAALAEALLAWSGVAQAGYLLAGVVVGTQLGMQATAFYLAVYLFMNVAAFAVVIARERVTELGTTSTLCATWAGRARGWRGR